MAIIDDIRVRSRFDPEGKNGGYKFEKGLEGTPKFETDAAYPAAERPCARPRRADYAEGPLGHGVYAEALRAWKFRNFYAHYSGQPTSFSGILPSVAERYQK